MGYPKRIVYMRHAQSEGNVLSLDDRLTARIPFHAYALTPFGLKQAAWSGKYLRERFGAFDACFVSTYSRTRATLEASGIDGPVYEDSRLDEAHFGIHHYLTQAQVTETYPHELARQAHVGNYWYRAIGGQSWPDIEARVRDFLRTLHDEWSGKTVLVVSHGNSFTAWRRVIEGIDIQEMMKARTEHFIDNCGIAVYRGVANWYAPWNRRHLELEHRTLPWEGHI